METSNTPVVLYDETPEYALMHIVNDDESTVVRGFITEKESNRVVAVSHHVHKPIILNKNQTIESLGLKNVTFTRGFESTAMRVWYNKGIVHCSTHKRIDPSNSRWGKSQTFTEMYKSLNGPTHELFDLTLESSDLMYIFLMVHPSIMIGSLEPPHANGYLVFLGYINIRYPTIMKKPFVLREDIVIPRDLCIDEVKEHLQFGFQCKQMLEMIDGTMLEIDTTNQRLQTGEFVIATEWTEKPWESPIKAIHQIHSVAYNYRCNFRNNNPNLWHRLFTLSTDAHLDLNEYNIKYPWISSVMPMDLNGVHTKMNLSAKENVTLEQSKSSHRLYNIWNCFMTILPFALKKEVSTLIHDFHIHRYMLGQFIYRNQEHTDKRIGQILTFAKQLMHNNNTSVSSNLLSSIHLVLRTERGDSLYRLVNIMVHD